MVEKNPDIILHTITSDLEITTDVDDLVELVRVKKELAMGDAAKHLKVDLATIEAWAGFLEEEGILAIKYKLTTPYLIEKAGAESIQFKQEGVEDVFGDKPKTRLKLEESTGPTKKVRMDIKPIEISLELTKGMNRLLEEAYKLIEKGDFEHAKQVYGIIKKDYDGLSTDFMDMKRELEKNLTKLNKDLLINLNKASDKQAKLLTKLIASEIRRMKIVMFHKDIKKAEVIFREIEQLYSRFPKGFMIRKTAIQNQILDAYKNLMRHKHVLLSKYVDLKVKEIGVLIEVIKTNLSSGDMQVAFDNYEKMRLIYNKIPKGFLQDQPQLEREIVQLLLELISSKQVYSANKVSQNTQQIKSLMASACACLANGQAQEANNQYKQLKKLYDDLPAGFLETKVVLEEKILHLHTNITKRLNKEYASQLSTGTKRIYSLIKKARVHLQKSESQIAEAVYKDIEDNYNSLPDGFLQQKTSLKVQILDLYRDILLRSDESVLMAFDPNQDKKYRDVVQMIVKTHDLIGQNKFDVFLHECSKISLLYNNLPKSFVQKKTKIGQEVTKLLNLANLYEKTRHMELSKHNHMELNLLINQTEKLYHSLVGKCPGDENLLNYVKQKMESYKIPYKKEAPKLTTPVHPIESLRSQPSTPRTSMPNAVKILLNQAESALSKNDLTKAKSFYEEVLKNDKDNAIAKSKLAWIKQNSEPTHDIYKKSISRVKEQKKEIPKHVESIRHLPKVPLKDITTENLDELYKVAVQHYEQKDYFNAIHMLREIKKQDSSYKNVQKLLKNSIREQDKLERIEMLGKLKDHGQSVTKSVAARRVITSELPKSGDRKSERAYLLSNIKIKRVKELIAHDRLREAEANLNNILKINPNDQEAKQLLGEIRAKQPQETLIQNA